MTQTVFIRGYFDIEIRVIILCLYSLIIFARVYYYRLLFTFSEIVWSIFTLLAVIGAFLNSKVLPLDIIQPIIWWFVVIGVVSVVRIARPNEEFLLKWFFALVIFELLIGIISIFDFLGLYNLESLLSTDLLNFKIFGDNHNFGCLIGKYALGLEMMIGLIALYGIFAISRMKNKNITTYNYLLYLVVLMVFFILLIYSTMRANVLALMVLYMLGLFFLYKNRSIDFKLVFYFAVFIILTLIISHLIGIANPFIKKILEAGTSNRSIIWKSFIDEQYNNFNLLSFLFGDGFRYIFEKYSILSSLKLAGFHNFVIDIWARYGFLNMLLIAYYIFIGIKKGLNNRFGSLIVPIVIACLVSDLSTGYFIPATFRLISIIVVFFIALSVDKSSDIELRNGVNDSN
jgi:hypothetical protein